MIEIRVYAGPELRDTAEADSAEGAMFYSLARQERQPKEALSLKYLLWPKGAEKCA